MNNLISQQPRLAVRRAADRGKSSFSWLDSSHSFSFGNYMDPEHMSFRSLRVINDDHVAAGGGFGTHSHRDMEILSYVVSGELEHRDSMGYGGVVSAGSLQAVSAGTGIAHSECNASQHSPVHFLQVWIVPRAGGLAPRYAEWQPTGQEQGLTLLASPEGSAGSAAIYQDASMYLGKLESGQVALHQTQRERGLWIQVISGELEVAGQNLHAGDGLALEETEEASIRAHADSQFLLFDLA